MQRSFLTNFSLKELWIDGNRIKQIPSLIGQLTDLVHFEASVNHIDYVADEIQACSKIQELALSTNELIGLPEAIGGLESLVTLKLDDNRVRSNCFSFKCLSYPKGLWRKWFNSFPLVQYFLFPADRRASFECWQTEEPRRANCWAELFRETSPVHWFM